VPGINGRKKKRDTLENRMLAKMGRGPFHNNNNNNNNM
jgi:hypothetical protein